MKRIFLAISAVLLSAALSAQTLVESVSLCVNSEDGLYAKGDTVRVWADVKTAPSVPVTFKVLRWCDWKAESETPVTLKEGRTLLFERVFNESVQYVFELTDGKAPREFKAKGGAGNVFAGIVVSPEEFKPGFEQPADLYEYWSKEIKAMRKKKIKPVITKDQVKDGYRVYHVDINCVGPAPARAYVAYPENAQKGTLPIIINLHAAGRPGAPSTAGAALSYARIVKGGALAMDINAHGMPDDQSKEFYDELSKGELQGYSTREPDGMDDYYFKWMMLRAERAVDYLTSNPLWDGKHIIVTGTSQGGYQSAWLAGIDPRITAAILTVPAGLDQGATLQGRPASWPKTIYKYKEQSIKTLPYIDPAAFLKNTKADIWCEIGLYDFTCPAANLFAVLNTCTCEKTIVTYQRPHSIAFNKEAHKGIDRQRKEFFQKAATK